LESWGRLGLGAAAARFDQASGWGELEGFAEQFHGGVVQGIAGLGGYGRKSAAEFALHAEFQALFIWG